MGLRGGTVWAIPSPLDVAAEVARSISPGSMLALRDPEGAMLAALQVEEVWKTELLEEAQEVYGTTNCEHAGVEYLLQRTHPWYVGGRLEGVHLPPHYDFRALRPTPSQLREEFIRRGWRRVVAFQTRNPMHRAHQELTLRASKKVQANLLIHPSVGMTKPGDVEYSVRASCYQSLLPKYPKDTGIIRLLPTSIRMSGARDALWHAIIRR